MSVQAFQILVALFVAVDPVRIPSDPGLYYLNPKGVTRIEGRAVTVAQTGSRVPLTGSLPMNRGKVNAQIIGESAEHKVISTPVFYFRVASGEEAAGAGDLVLVKLKTKHSRREFQLSAQRDWQAGSGISLRSQLQFYTKQVERGVYKLVPAQDLERGEYGFYLFRGHDLPGFIYDFSVE